VDQASKGEQRSWQDEVPMSRQGWQTWSIMLQIGRPASVQLALLTHWTQAFVIVSQWVARGPVQFMSVKHWTQWAGVADVSQTGVPAVPPASSAHCAELVQERVHALVARSHTWPIVQLPSPTHWTQVPADEQ
jgi:hypothetical protein